jgi:hypothetical protein
MPLLQEGGDVPPGPIHMKVHPPHHHPQGVGAVTDGIGALRGLATGVIEKLVDAIVAKRKANAIGDVGVVDILLAPIALHLACGPHGDQAKKGRVMLEFTSSNNWATDEQRYKSTLTETYGVCPPYGMVPNSNRRLSRKIKERRDHIIFLLSSFDI